MGEYDELRGMLQRANDLLKKQQATINAMSVPPNRLGVVLSTVGDFCQVRSDEDMLLLNKPGGFSITPGDYVRLNVETLQMVGLANDFRSIGSPAVVHKIFPPAKGSGTIFAQVEMTNGEAVVVISPTKVNESDEVLIDPLRSVIIRVLDSEHKPFQYEAVTGVSWTDIGGLEDAKAQLREAIEFPRRYAEHYRFYHKRPVKGVELFGPPGCGKTMLAKAVATALAEMAGNTNASGFFYVRGPELLNMWVGMSEANIRGLFSSCRKHMAKFNHPATLFIDEADAILSKRGSGVSSDMEKTIVPMFLAEMDGLDPAGAVVLLASNRPDRLDPAIVRPGRIDRKVKVSRPDKAQTVEIFKVHLKDVPVAEDRDGLSEQAAQDLFDPSRVLYKFVMRDRHEENFTLGHVASGAMCANVVDRATSICMRKDIASHRRGKGLTRQAMSEAVTLVHTAVGFDNLHDDLTDFAASLGEEPISMIKV